MTEDLKIAQKLYFNLKDSLKKGLITQENYDIFINNLSEMFKLTEFELKFAKQEFKEFVIKHNLIVSSFDKHGFSVPFEDYKYSIARLKLHIKFSEYSLYMLYYIAEANFEQVLEDLNISEEDEINEWEIFKEELYLTKDKLIYEQSLISLLTIFENYINNILHLILLEDSSVRSKIKINVSFTEILANLEEMEDFLINKEIERKTSWKDKFDSLKNSPVKIDLRKNKNYDIINDAIIKRNILVHNKGIISNRFLKELNENKLPETEKYHLNDKITVGRKYYYLLQEAIGNIVEVIDNKVKEKYHKH